MKRMSNRVFVVLLGLCLSMVLSGCGRIIQWARPMFDQGTPLACYEGKAQDYLRYAVVYHGADIEGMFDVLWLNAPVRQAYVQAYVQRFGTSASNQQAMLAQQKQEQQERISFIVLSLFNKPLGVPESEWGVFLKVGDKQYTPSSIKPYDLEPEYQDVFDYRYDKFKNVYIVRFDAVDVQGKKIVTAQTPCIELVFRSTHKQAVVAWHVDCLACDWAARADVVANEWQVYKPRRRFAAAIGIKGAYGFLP